MPEKTDKPDQMSGAAARMEPLVKTARDVYGGTTSMQRAGAVYLPQHPAEPNDAYAARLRGTVLYNALDRTVDGLVGLIFRKDVDLQNADKRIEEHAEDIDLTGRPLNRFTRDAATETLVDGIGFILVDYPESDPSAATLEDERRQGLRPNWVYIRAEQFISARFTVVGGLPVLSQFVYRENVEEPAGTFTTEEVTQYRVLRVTAEGMGEYEIWRNAVKGSKTELELWREGTFQMPGAEGTVVPVVPVYGGRVAHFEAKPPLLDLAYENIAHWQLRSDHYYALHVSNVPIPVFIGRARGQDDELVISPGRGLDIPEGGDAKYLEFSGKSLQHSRDELRDIEARMASLGLSMLQRDTRAAETAEAKRIDKVAEDSALAEFAGGLEAAVNEALGLHARWIGSATPGEVTINRDYMPGTLSEGQIREFRAMVAEGALSLDTLWKVLEEGELLPDGFDPELERELILRPVLPVVPAPVPSPPAEPEGDEDDDEDQAA